MRRSTDRILTTHPGRLPDPDNRTAVMAACNSGDLRHFDDLVPAGVAEIIRRQQGIGVDIMSDGEFWKGGDQKYYDSRVSGIRKRPLRPGEYGSLSAQQPERRSPEFRAFWEIYDRTGNTPMPGVEFRGRSHETERYIIASPLTAKGTEASPRLAKSRR